MIIGRLGKDVESRFFQDGTACCNFSVACSEKWKDKQSGEQKEHTEWINVSAVGRLAEVCVQYLSKGSLVYCEGKQATRKYQDRDGQDRYVTELKLREMKMLDSKQHNQRQTAQQPAAQYANQQKQQDPFIPAAGQHAGEPDDIPFS